MGRPHVVFLATHLLTERLVSGGDVLFAHAAQALAEISGWRIGVLAPTIAAANLQEYFDEVHEIREDPKLAERALRRIWRIPARWATRIPPAQAMLRGLQPDLVHSTGDFFPNTAVGHFAKRTLGSAFTSVIHHINAAPHKRHAGLVQASVSFALQQLALRSLKSDADGIALLNADTRAHLARSGFDDRRLFIVGGAIDLRRFPPAAVPPTQNRLLWVHRLEPTKGILDLPDILRRLPRSVTIDVVGGGPPEGRQAFKKRIEAAGIADRVRVHGFVDDGALRELYEAANVFVSCSHEEGWGISLCEALAVGLPCVAYDLPSYREVFGSALRVVPPGDTAAFAAAIEATLEERDSTADRDGRRSVASRYTYDRLASRQHEMFLFALERAKRPT